MSEQAFADGIGEETSYLSEVFDGASYSAFGGTIVCCHIFNLILKHVYRLRPGDKPADVNYGPFWHRHTELDNALSNTFMFLPENLRMPQNLRNPTAVNTNLNLHAATICLHHAAMSMIETYQLPDSMKASTLVRMRTAAEEIVKLFHLTSSMATSPVRAIFFLSPFALKNVAQPT